MIDSHSHIYCDAFDEDRDAVVQRARDAGVRHIVLPCENVAALERIRALHDRYPSFTSMCIGLHPAEVNADYITELSTLATLLGRAPEQWVAIGEIGIDLYWDKTYRREQMQALDMQLRLCLDYDLPFVMHCREGLDEIIEVMQGLERVPQGVFHSFTGTPADVERLRTIGDFYFGVNGIVTFKKSEVKHLLPVVGLNRLLVETDSPYLAPVPHRGKRNESAFIPHIVEFVANEMGITPAQVSAATDQNAERLFSINIVD